MLSVVEKAYQVFKNSKDQTKLIDRKLYFRIICSEYFEITGREGGILSIVPSPDMPKSTDSIYQDENGNHFTFGSFQFLSFIGDVPEWYLNCGVYCMKWKESKNIGKYLTIIE